MVVTCSYVNNQVKNPIIIALFVTSIALSPIIANMKIVNAQNETNMTKEGQNQTARKSVPTNFCLEGTGGGTGNLCVPCDPASAELGYAKACSIPSGSNTSEAYSNSNNK